MLANGSLKSLSSRRSLVTGQLVVLGEGCQVPLTSATLKVPGCEQYAFCSATIVRDSSVSAAPFVLSAAHCFKKFKDSFDTIDCGQRKLPSALHRSSMALYFYSQASKKHIRLGRPVMHPSYLVAGNALSFTRLYDDIAVINIASEDVSRVTDFASIEKNIPRLTPEVPLFAKLSEDIGGDSRKNDRLTHFVTSFPLSAFDNAPIAELLGSGMIDNGIGYRITRVDLTESNCKEPNEWFPPFGCLNKDTVGIENEGFPLRSVKMRVAYSSAEKAVAVFVPRKEFPREGTCQGDSGGPAFLGEGDTTAVFAVESYGPHPCAGSPTVRAIVAPHMRALQGMLQIGLQPPASCR